MSQFYNTLKGQSRKLLLCAMLANIYATVCVATTPDAAVAAKPVSGKKMATTFKLAKDAPLTLSLLDHCWNNRENIENQKMIIEYLQTNPQVPEDYQIAWKTARLVYFIGNYGIGENQFTTTRAGVKLFDYGVKAGELAMKLNPDGVEGYYWYAVDLGSYGLANGIIASAIHAKDGMKALKKAMEIDPTYHWYGSSRVLGRYYQELPGLFGGDSAKAHELFITATEKAPQFDNNWIYLGRYYNHKGRYKEGLAACERALSIENSLSGAYEEVRFNREASDCIKKAQSKL